MVKHKQFESHCADLLASEKWTEVQHVSESMLVKGLFTDKTFSFFSKSLINNERWQENSQLLKLPLIAQRRIANQLFNAAYFSKKNGKSKEAIALYQASLTLRIDGPEEVCLNLSVIFSEALKNSALAKHWLEKSLEYNARYTIAIYNLAGLYEELGEKSRAIEAYRRLLDLEPDNSLAMSRLVYCLDAENLDDGLIEHLKTLSTTITQQKSNHLAATVQYALGEAYNKKKNYKKAFSAYTQANKLEAFNYDANAMETRVDELISTFNSEWKNLLPISGEVRPIFICGMFRSGSTLLEQILAGHSQVSAGGELDYFDKLYKSITTKMGSNISVLDSTFIQKAKKEYIKLLDGISLNGMFVTDKRPDNFLLIGLIKSIFPMAKILYTRRNKLENCLSVYFQQLDHSQSYSSKLSDIEHFYAQQEKLLRHWTSLFPGSIFEINYEDIVDDPRNTLSSFFNSIDIEWEQGCDQFHLNKNSVATASIWQVRKPLYKDSKNRGENYKQYIVES